MGRRSRRRAEGEGGGGAAPSIPDAEYTLSDGGLLALRCALTPRTRAEYAKVRSGQADRPGASREDAWQRSVEYLFERLATRWVASDVEYEGQKEILMRFRVASQDERAAIRMALREHLAEWFPEMDAP